MQDKPAILGGKPIFKELIPMVKPSFRKYVRSYMLDRIREILESGMVTNARFVAELEKSLGEILNATYLVATNSCTLGMILAFQQLNLQGKIVLMPSFTFSATAHAAYWNNTKIKLVDCDPDTFNVSIDSVQENIDESVGAIIGTHIFGNPCEIQPLIEIAQDNDVTLLFDAAHGVGGSYRGKGLGFWGDASVFSGSPTKLFTTMEGGFVATPHADLAEHIRIGRNYGNRKDYTCKDPGLNARMTEISAVVGLSMLDDLETFVKNRNDYVAKFKKILGKLDGLSFQSITPNSISTFKDFAIIVDPVEFGISRDLLHICLTKENISSRKYFSPAVHELEAYQKKIETQKKLVATREVSMKVLCLPIYNSMSPKLIERICNAIEKIHSYSAELASLKDLNG